MNLRSSYSSSTFCPAIGPPLPISLTTAANHLTTTTTTPIRPLLCHSPTGYENPQQQQHVSYNHHYRNQHENQQQQQFAQHAIKLGTFDANWQDDQEEEEEEVNNGKGDRTTSWRVGKEKNATANFPVDPSRSTTFCCNNANNAQRLNGDNKNSIADNNIVGQTASCSTNHYQQQQQKSDPYYFFEPNQLMQQYQHHYHQSQQNEMDDYMFDDDDQFDMDVGSNESSTQSLLLWQQRQQHKIQQQRQQQKFQFALPSHTSSNGALFQLDQKTIFSSCSGSATVAWWPWSSLTESTKHLNGKRSSRVILRKKENFLLLPGLIGALLCLSIALLLCTVILIINQQMEFERQMTDTIAPYHRQMKENVQKMNESSRQLMALFNGSKIRENLHWIAAKMHVAGTIEQLELMDKLANKYRSFGFDVTSFEYPEVLLSMPNYNQPNTIHAWNEHSLRWELVSDGIGQALNRLKEVDGELRQQLDGNEQRMHVWWNAYARNATALGELVYANYGTKEDFEQLEKLNITINGKILLIRYGGIFRGEKVHLAEQRGAIGVILYSDPFDYVPGNKTFPDDLWLPPSASQRGTLYLGSGDPETPFLPSLSYAHRQFNEEQLRANGILPNIPVTSIGYENAQKLFELMDGIMAPWSRWVGSLPITYRLTGSVLLRLDVNTQNGRRKIKNFVAKLHGREEPDRWVLLGNHADAWTKGSIDPGTGTSIMLEMARVLGEHAEKSGWQPRRTIVFCQWDAEEFGLIGSTEWIEQHLQLLQSRAVAYINMDNFNGNTTLSIKSVPVLYRLIVDAAARVSQPVKSELEHNRNTLLDSWRFHNTRAALPGDRTIPFVQLPHSGSDFQRFISYAGIPVADLRMENVPYSYMLYHTAYEVPWYNDNFLDPDKETSVALGRLWLEIVRQLAENMIIPFNVEDYGIAMADFLAKADSQIRLHGIVKALGERSYQEKFVYLQKAIGNFQKISQQFQRVIQAINSAEKQITLLQREQFNHRLLTLERCFLLPHQQQKRGNNGGGRGEFRHVIFSAPEEEQNSGFALPFLLDPVAKWLAANTFKDPVEAAEQLENIRLAFSWLQYCVECASQVLKVDGDGEEEVAVAEDEGGEFFVVNNGLEEENN